MTMTTGRLVCAMALAVAVGPTVAFADWTQWRGEARDGVASASASVEEWPEALSLTWRHQIGLGHATPAVAGGRIYTHSRQGDDEVVSCLTLDTHDLVWSKSYAAPYRMNPAARGHGPGPKSSPTLANGTLVTLGISGILSAYDASTGDLRWQKRFDGRFASTSPVFGTAMSPLVDRDVVIAHVGGDGDGALIALDLATGDERWAWDGDGPGYASPVVVELSGVRQYVTQTQNMVVSVAPASGALLWSMPYKTPYEQNTITPLLYGDTILLSGLESGTVAMRPREDGGVWALEEVWRSPFSMYMSSPVLSGDRLVGLAGKRKGQFFCISPATGATLWETEGREGDYAGIVRLGDAFVCLTPDAELHVIRDSADGYDEIARYTVADKPTWAHPVVLDGRILVKDEDSLSLWSLR
ncbi:serine/threonine protein kinase [Candidatus Poribacteria bacterium]|nr:serine/threonine protein kinase [Candidatus Poribacteria bacterium]